MGKTKLDRSFIDAFPLAGNDALRSIELRLDFGERVKRLVTESAYQVEAELKGAKGGYEEDIAEVWGGIVEEGPEQRVTSHGD